MEKLGDDVLGLILERISDSGDRSSFSVVCKQWARVEGLSRTSLRVLEPERNPKFLRRFPNLTTLEIDRTISDRNLKSIAEMCPNLRILNLDLCENDWKNSWRLRDFGGNGLRAVAAKCQFLTNVSLRRRGHLQDAGVIALLSNAKELTVLDLSRCSKITDKALDAMDRMGSLEELYLKGCTLITNEGLISLAIGSPAKTLRILDLAECDQITDFITYLLPQMPCLEELNLADCGPKITDEGGVVISRISSLRILDFSWLINITDDTVIAVAENCQNLVGIKLTGCESVTGVGVRAFAGLGSLEMLGVARCYLVCGHDVEEMLFQCTSLRHLVLDKKLREWMSPSANEKLSMLHKVDWV